MLALWEVSAPELEDTVPGSGTPWWNLNDLGDWRTVIGAFLADGIWWKPKEVEDVGNSGR